MVVDNIEDDVVELEDEDDKILDHNWMVQTLVPNTASDDEEVSDVISP